MVLITTSIIAVVLDSKKFEKLDPSSEARRHEEKRHLVVSFLKQ